MSDKVLFYHYWNETIKWWSENPVRDLVRDTGFTQQKEDPPLKTEWIVRSFMKSNFTWKIWYIFFIFVRPSNSFQLHQILTFSVRYLTKTNERRELKWEFVGVIPFSAGSSAVHQFTSTSGGGTRWRICWAGIRGHLFRPWLETLSVTITCETWRATTCRGC